MKEIVFIAKKFEPKTGKSKHMYDLAKTLGLARVTILTNRVVLAPNQTLPKELDVRVVPCSDHVFYFKIRKILHSLPAKTKVIFFGGLIAALFMPFYKRKEGFVFDIRDIPVSHKELSHLTFIEIKDSFSFVLNIDDILGFFLGKKILKRLLRNADLKKVITPVKGLARTLDTGKTTYIPYGVDITKYTPLPKNQARKKRGYSPKDFILFFYGRAVMLRGMDTIIDAFEKLREETSHAKLVLNLLPDINLDATIARAQSSKYKKDITIKVGFVKDNEIDISAADVVLFPFKTTGCIPPIPLTLVEAMACDTCAITTNIGYLSEIITHGKEGYLVKPNNPLSLYAALKSIHDNPLQKKRMAQNASTKIEQAYNLATIGRTYESVLEEAFHESEKTV